MKITAQSPAKRCDICHQSDCFDPINESCLRCNQLIPTIQMIPPAVRSIIEPELVSGEIILWAAQPNPIRMVIESLSFWLGASILVSVGAFILAMDYVKCPVDFLGWQTIGSFLILLPFFIGGLIMFFAPGWAYFLAPRTVYGLTNHRILIIEGIPTKRVKIFKAAAIGKIERRDLPYQLGDVTFAQKITKDQDGDTHTEDIKLFGIKEARFVQQLISDTFAKR